MTKRDEPRLIAWSNTAEKNVDGTVDYVIRTGVDVTEREKAQSQLRESDAAVRTLRQTSEVRPLQDQKELHSLTARLLGLQEAGNKDLARELHDDLSQKLAALGMEVSTLLQPSSGSPQNSRIASVVSALGSTAWRKMFTQCPGGFIPQSLMSLAWKPP